MGSMAQPSPPTAARWSSGTSETTWWVCGTSPLAERYGSTFPDEEDPPRPKPVGGRPVYNGAVSPDGRIIAFGSQSRFLELRDLATGALLNRLDKLPDGVCPMAFSPDCKTLAW